MGDLRALPQRSAAVEATSTLPILERIRSRTPARFLAGRAGASYRTSTYLELRADHAAARDAVTTELDLDADLGAAVVAEWGLFEVPTLARTRADYLLRPELGRSLPRRRGPRSRRSVPRASTSRWRSPTASRPRRCGCRSPRSCR